jgi:hypothetical protein
MPLIIFLEVVLGFSLLVSERAEFSGTSTIAAASTAPTLAEIRTDCSDRETGWKIEKLNGKVKSLQEEQIEYGYGSGKKELTRLVTFGPSGDYLKDDHRQYFRVVDYSKIDKPTFVFDKDCRVLERRDPKRPDRLAGASRSVFSYTPSGTLQESATYDPEGRLLWKSVATLDKNERVIETNDMIQEHPEHYNPKRYDVYRHTRRLYKLDDAGTQIEEISYDWQEKLYAIYKRAYDPAGRLVWELRLDHKNRPINLNIYKYDEAGVLQEELKYSSASYSGLDELVPGTLDSGYGNFQDGRRITYEYDQAKNWIKKTEFDFAENGKLSRATYRTLVYY